MTFTEAAVALFVDGGLTVATEGARTTIQPDGDLVMKVTPALLDDAALRRAHADAVAAQLASLRTLQRRLRWLRRLAISAAALLPVLAVVSFARSAHHLRDALRPAIELGASSLLAFAARQRGRLLRWLLARALRRVAGSAARGVSDTA